MRQSFFHGSVGHGGGAHISQHTANWEACVIVWMVLAFFLMLAAAILFAASRGGITTPSLPLPNWPL